MEFSEIELA